MTHVTPAAAEPHVESVAPPHDTFLAPVDAWIVPPRASYFFDAESVLGAYVEAQTVKTLKRSGLTMDKVEELVVLLDAYLAKVSE